MEIYIKDSCEYMWVITCCSEVADVLYNGCAVRTDGQMWGWMMDCAAEQIRSSYQRHMR